jgi:solute carrier family 25 (mitochondrial uncoupling protein), member 8/9
MNTRKLEGESHTAYLIRNWLMASAGSIFAEFISTPFDTAKVRLQIQVTERGTQPRYKGVLGTMPKVAAEEGILALWSGFNAAVQRGFLFSGLRIGMYVPIKNLITGDLPPG